MLTSEEAAALTASVAMEMAGGLIDADALYAARRQRTYRHDNPGLARDPEDRPNSSFGNAKRAGSALARFVNAAVTEPVDRSRASLNPRHPALTEGRTIFPNRVFGADDRDRVLISGINNAKLGKKVTVGAWAGFPIYTLSLEERATCPLSCAVWDACYGSGMPAAVRFRYDVTLLKAIERDLTLISRSVGRKGFVVRLHVLGDFPDARYAREWARWSTAFPLLHVEGYTAHPRQSEIGSIIAAMNAKRPERWQIRNSVAPDAPYAPMQVTTLWETPSKMSYDRETKTMVCPQELGKTATCGTCGACWKPELNHVRVAFLGHGGRGK